MESSIDCLLSLLLNKLIIVYKFRLQSDISRLEAKIERLEAQIAAKDRELATLTRTVRSFFICSFPSIHDKHA
jgi:hypothetical protein